MAVTGADYQIQITSEADLNGLKATLAALEADTAAAERMGVSVKGAYEQIAATKSAINAYESAVNKARQEVGKLDISHREVHQAMHLVAESAGGALGPIGELTHMLGNPYIMAAAGAALAIKMLIEQHAALREVQLKNIETSNELAAAMRNAGETAARENAQHIHELGEHFKRFGENVDTATEAMRRFMRVNGEILASQESNLTATNALIAALIHEQEVLGHFSSGEAGFLARRAQNQEARQREGEQEERQQADIDLQKQRAADAKREGDAAAASAQSLTGGRGTVNDKIAGLGAIAEGLRNALPDLVKASNEAQASLPRLIEHAASTAASAAAARGTAAGPSAQLQAQDAANKLADARLAISQAKAQEDAVQKAEANKALAEQELRDIDQEIEHQKSIAAARLELFRTTMQAVGEAQEHLRRQSSDFIRDQRTREETQRVQRRTELEQRQRNGTITPEEALVLDAINDRPRPGLDDLGRPQTPRNDLNALIGQANEIYRRLRGETPEQRAADPGVAQLQSLLDAIMGFAQNSNATVRNLAERWIDHSQAIFELQAQLRQVESILQQTGNTRG